MRARGETVLSGTECCCCPRPLDAVLPQSLLLDGVSALYYCCFARDLDEGVERWGELHRVFFRLPGAAEAAKDAGPAAMARGARLGEGADEAFLPPEFEVGASPAVWKL